MQRVAGLPARHARNGPVGNPSGGRALPGNGARDCGAPAKSIANGPRGAAEPGCGVICNSCPIRVAIDIMRGIGYNISEMTTPLHNGIAGARLRARCEAVSPRAVRGVSLRRTRVGALYAASAAIPAGGLLREVRDRSPRVFCLTQSAQSTQSCLRRHSASIL